VDNAKEFTTKSFENYCIATGINLETSIPQVHNSNAENAVKLIQNVARTMLLSRQLPSSCWGYAVLHATQILRLRPTSRETQSPYELVNALRPSVKNLNIFGTGVYVSVERTKGEKMSAFRKLAIYVGMISNSICKVLDPSTGTSSRVHVSNCVFDETIFPSKSNTLNFENRELNFNLEPTFLGFKDIPTRDRDKEVRTILHLHNVAKAAPDRFQVTEKLIQEETKRDLTSTFTTPRPRPRERKRKIRDEEYDSFEGRRYVAREVQDNFVDENARNRWTTPNQHWSETVCNYGTITPNQDEVTQYLGTGYVKPLFVYAHSDKL
jgi:hypothetical protein